MAPCEKSGSCREEFCTSDPCHELRTCLLGSGWNNGAWNFLGRGSKIPKNSETVCGEQLETGISRRRTGVKPRNAFLPWTRNVPAPQNRHPIRASSGRSGTSAGDSAAPLLNLQNCLTSKSLPVSAKRVKKPPASAMSQTNRDSNCRMNEAGIACHLGSSNSGHCRGGGRQLGTCGFLGCGVESL